MVNSFLWHLMSLVVLSIRICCLRCGWHRIMILGKILGIMVQWVNFTEEVISDYRTVNNMTRITTWAWLTHLPKPSITAWPLESEEKKTFVSYLLCNEHCAAYTNILHNSEKNTSVSFHSVSACLSSTFDSCSVSTTSYHTFVQENLFAISVPSCGYNNIPETR